MVFKKIDHVQLAIPIGQEDVARKFYRDLLGMAEVNKPHPLAARGGCWFEHDEVRLRWREQIERGWQDAQAGRLVDGDDAFRRIDARIKKAAARKRG